MPRLVLTDGRNVLGTYDLGSGRTLIGRSSEAEVPLDDLTVSRRHAEIHCTGASYFVSNLAGQNGVFVDGRWIDTHKLGDGDTIEIARYRLRFELTDAERGAAARQTAEDSFRLTRDEVHRAVGRTDPDEVVASFEQQRRQRSSRLDSKQQTFAMQPAEMERTRERLQRAAQAQVRIAAGGGLQTIYLDDPKIRIGGDPTCQVPIGGRGVAAELHLSEARWHLVPTGGKVLAGGKPVKAVHVLRNEEFFEVDGVRVQFLDAL